LLSQWPFYLCSMSMRGLCTMLIKFTTVSEASRKIITLTWCIKLNLFNGNHQATRALSYQIMNKGGLNIPNYRARVIAIQCNWIMRLKTCKGSFRQVFTYADIDWHDENSFSTPFPSQKGSDYSDSCLEVWTKNLRFLAFQTSRCPYCAFGRH
jgi:hypothetical protein